MRVLAIVLALAAIAAADPVRFEYLAGRTRDPRVAVRIGAAKEIAEAIYTTGEGRIAALQAVITNDPEVRAPLVAALVDTRVLDPTSAARIPSLDTLESMLRVLVHDKLLLATTCVVTGGKPLTLRCERGSCHDCQHEVATATLVVGAQWRVVAHDHTSRDDGSCGFCD